MSLKISAQVKELIPSIVQVSDFVNRINILDKKVNFDFEDKGIYNKITSLVTYYGVNNSDKNCCKKYKEFSDLIPVLNTMLAQHRVAVMKVSFGEDNPFLQTPFILDHI